MTNYTVRIEGHDSQGNRGHVDLPVRVTAPSTKTRLGAAGWDNAGYLATETAVLGAGAMFPCRRIFDDFPATWATSKAATSSAVGRHIYLSVKPPVGFASNVAAQNQLRTVLLGRPAGQRVSVIVRHEPESKIKSGAYTLAEWQADASKAGEVVHSIGSPDVDNGICIQGYYTLDTRGPYAAWDWDGATNPLWDWANIDFVAIDPYKFNPGDPSMEQLLTVKNSGSNSGTGVACMTKLLQWGKPIVIGEWGCTQTNVSIEAKAGWIADAARFLTAWNRAHPAVPIRDAMYFDIDNFATNGTEPRATWKLSGAALDAFRSAVLDSRA